MIRSPVRLSLCGAVPTDITGVRHRPGGNVITAPQLVPRTPVPAMSLLSHGVPLTLIIDLFFGPRSAELMDAERGAVIPQPRPPAACA